MNMMFTLCLLLCATLALGQKTPEVPPDHPLTKCQEEASVTPIPRVYVPQCDPQGQYLPTQCAGGFTAPCWCVNTDGQEIPGTRIFGGQRPNCAVSPNHPLTKCQKEASVTHLIGAYVPQCDSQGQYLPIQCWGSTGYCWCVNAAGEEVQGTRTPPGQPRPNCAVSPNHPLTKCQKEASVTHLIGAYVPQCDSQGQYLPIQCWGSTGYCWCVTANGDGLPDTETAPGQPRPNCAVRPQTFCQYWRSSVTPLPGAYVPQCDSQGQFLPTQCWGSTGHCWCVTANGDGIPDTETAPGQPRPNCE